MEIGKVKRIIKIKPQPKPIQVPNWPTPATTPIPVPNWPSPVQVPAPTQK